MHAALALALGYLLGSIPFTQLVARWRKGLDLRTVGSGNVGGMNTIQNVGLFWGLLAGTLDVAKGFAAIALTQALGAPAPWHLWAGLAAVAGHNWPVWLRFRGGKGIAVTMGLGAYVAFPEMLAGFLLGLLVLKLTRNVVFTAAAGFLATIFLLPLFGRPPEAAQVLWGAVAIMVIATLPGAIRTLATPGALREYLRNPMKVYEKPSKSEDNHS
ncbi:MAG: glycerol-3-phosphate acyltransferase [Chloroflexi bacterium]|nr:glycerol-3-phosphate acyltransferase [Chloroflexota bacterium]